MAPPGRSDKGENNNDGYDYQMYTLLCLLGGIRRNQSIISYEIGKGSSADFGAFDDVNLVMKMDSGCEDIYAIQVKQSSNDKSIQSNDLWGKNNNNNFDVRKYFKSYLQIKEHLETNNQFHHLKYMIMWTTYDIGRDAVQFFKEVSSTGDFLDQAINHKIYKKWKITNYDCYQEEILDYAHPLSKTVEDFVAVLFKKEEWNSQKAAKSCYRIMAQQVIDTNGPSFRQEFIDGDNNVLSPDTLTFRRIFERTMVKRFKKMKFAMDLLNSNEYKQIFELKIDVQFTEGPRNPSWNVKNVPTAIDLSDFFDRFVFFVNLPKINEFKAFLASEYGVLFKQITELLHPYTRTQMASKEEIEAIFTIIDLRNLNDFKGNSQLKFIDNTIQEELKRVQKYMFIEAPLDVECSTLRVLSALENEQKMNPFLILTNESFNKNRQKILSVAKHAAIVEGGLKCMVVSSADMASAKQTMEEFRSTATLKIIFIGESWKGDKAENCTYIEDDFDVAKLSVPSMEAICDRQIYNFGNLTSVNQIFDKDLFSNRNHKLVLELSRNSELIKIGENYLTLDRCFSSRLETGFDSLVVHEVAIIQDQAGTGKTTELTSITLQLRQMFPGHMVVFIDCKEAVELYSGNAVDTVCSLIDTRTSVQRLIVEEIFRLRKVFILMDGFDEVSEECSSELMAMISDFHKLKPRGLYFATRPYQKELNMIEKAIGKCKAYPLKAFTKEEQIEYLEKCWEIDEIQSDAERDRVKCNIVSLVDIFHNTLRGASLLGAPLQMFMIGTIYSDSIRSTGFEPPKSYQIGSVVEEFVQRKFVLIQGKPSDKASSMAFKVLKAKYIPSHVLVAYHIYKRQFKDATEKFADLEMYGLIRLKPSVSFVHDTYYRFFLALYFLSYHTAPIDFKQFMSANLCPNRIDITTKFMDYHIGVLSTSTKNLEGERILEIQDPVFEVPKGTLVHPDKIREFNNYLYDPSNMIINLFDLIRKSFNATSFNVFEVLYDSLNESDKHNLKFRYEGDTEERINLKRLGGDQTCNLLRIMFKKRPETFVRSFLIDFPEDKEDILEVACRKPFLQVFQWLAEEIKKFETSDRISLNVYISNRIPGYFMLLLRHNNASVLGEILQWANNNFSKDVLKQLMEEKNLMEVFVANIDRKADNKPFILEERIRMIELMSEFYYRIYEQNVLLTDKCFDNIENVEIKDAFKKNL